MINNEAGTSSKEQGHRDNRQETVFGKRWGGREEEARKLTLATRCAEKAVGFRRK